MPRLIDIAEPNSTDAIELGALIEMLETERFDARDEDCFASFGPALARLANHRSFLADYAVDELKQRCQTQNARNSYGPQVVLLHHTSNFVIRANFWPAEHDAVIAHNDPSTFFYHLPHDHNFSFLTAGYLGPGYWSDYYEYDSDPVLGVPGESVALRFVERSRLAQGQVLLYRAHRDVHAQRPADSLSVSLNILEQSPTLGYRNQYRFDLATGAIGEVLTQTPIEPLLMLCAQLGDGEAQSVVSDFAATHPCDRIRFTAVAALAAAQPDIDSRRAIFQAATRQGNRYVDHMAARQLAAIDRGRSWIAAGRA